jgi:hypothetical protein
VSAADTVLEAAALSDCWESLSQKFVKKHIAMASVDNIHVSEVERLLKLGRDALFGVGAAGDL